MRMPLFNICFKTAELGLYWAGSVWSHARLLRHTSPRSRIGTFLLTFSLIFEILIEVVLQEFFLLLWFWWKVGMHRLNLTFLQSHGLWIVELTEEAVVLFAANVLSLRSRQRCVLPMLILVLDGTSLVNSVPPKVAILELPLWSCKCFRLPVDWAVRAIDLILSQQCLTLQWCNSLVNIWLPPLQQKILVALWHNLWASAFWNLERVSGGLVLCEFFYQLLLLTVFVCLCIKIDH